MGEDDNFLKSYRLLIRSPLYSRSSLIVHARILVEYVVSNDKISTMDLLHLRSKVMDGFVSLRSLIIPELDERVFQNITR